MTVARKKTPLLELVWSRRQTGLRARRCSTHQHHIHFDISAVDWTRDETRKLFFAKFGSRFHPARRVGAFSFSFSFSSSLCFLSVHRSIALDTLPPGLSFYSHSNLKKLLDGRLDLLGRGGRGESVDDLSLLVDEELRTWNERGKERGSDPGDVSDEQRRFKEMKLTFSKFC